MMAVMMATSDDKLHISDENWLIFRARSCLNEDQYAARAWLLTARTLFPRNLEIQLESYNLEKHNKNVKDTAKCLEEMFSNFPQEPKIWREIVSLAKSLNAEETEDNEFYSSVFNSLPKMLQCHMLLSIAETVSDIIEKTKLMLIVLQRYPEKISEHGVKLIDGLLTAEKQAYVPSPVNCYRKYIVCDILLLVLKSSELTPKLVYRWLQKATEFCTCYIAQQSTIILDEPTSDWLSSKKAGNVSFSTQALRRIKIPGIPDNESFIADPWGLLFDIVYAAAHQLRWDIASLYHQSSRELQFNQISMLLEEMKTKADKSAAHKQVLYCGVPLLLHCLFQYSVQVDPEQFAGSCSQNGFQRFLALTVTPQVYPYGNLTKKAKLDDDAILSVSPLITDDSELKDNILIAFKLWSLLNSVEALRHDFHRLLQHWKSDNWLWLKSFEIDYEIYQGSYVEALALLDVLQSKRIGVVHLRMDLQRICCYQQLKQYKQCIECILRVIKKLPDPISTPPPVPVNLSHHQDRHLHLLACVDNEVLPYCIQFLLVCLMEKGFGPIQDHLCLGHMIVLTQYDWPTHQNIFNRIVAVIKKFETFVYNSFFSYIINIDILEEFAHLKTHDSGKITLDILPSGSQVHTQQRTVTRGVNKGAKEDFRSTAEKQAARSNENVDVLIRQFLETEEASLLRLTQMFD